MTDNLNGARQLLHKRLALPTRIACIRKYAVRSTCKEQEQSGATFCNSILDGQFAPRVRCMQDVKKYPLEKG